MIPDEVVERIREAADGISVIGEYVKLKRVGNSYRGPCPFHHGKHANFSVNDHGYKCFVCGASGDVFTFVQKHVGVDFVESVKLIGAKVGIEVTEVARGADDRDSREPLWEVNAAAADFFQSQLWNSPNGRLAREYLASRGLSKTEADRFGIGYAPREVNLMPQALRSLGFDDQRQLAAGLVVAKDEKPELRTRFRDRVIFPIFDKSDHIVGFGGRLLSPGEPKYLNTGESAIYSKREVLYGFNWAKQSSRKAERLVIVEGYFDVIRLMLAGITETVATSGTALTEQQAEMISKHQVKKVFLLYDSDQAGLKATFRAGDVLLSKGLKVSVISLPDGEDPDTYVAKTGAAGFERAAAESVDIFDRKIQFLERGGWFSDLQRKREALDKLLPTIRAAANIGTKGLYLARVSEVAGISQEMLQQELAAPSRETRRRAPRPESVPEMRDEPPFSDDDLPPTPVRPPDRRLSTRVRGVRAERELVRVLLHHRKFIEAAAERIGADMFVDPVYGGIFAELAAGEPDVMIDVLAAALDEESTEVLQELVAEPGGLERPDEVVNGSINMLLSRELSDRLANIDRLMPLADSNEKDRLIGEKRRLSAEILALGRPHWKHFNSARS
ncbi:MAG: DNA primase [Gemmatimonadaceae bacterium]